LPYEAVWSTIDTLHVNQTLQPNQDLWSSDAKYQAIMQSDGNFVVYGPGRAVEWSSGTNGNYNAYLVMGNDGNLVLYSQGGYPLWATRTQPSSNDRLVMQPDGNLVVYNGSNNAACWSYRTGRLSC
jgi:hypothetical protein